MIFFENNSKYIFRLFKSYKILYIYRFIYFFKLLDEKDMRPSLPSSLPVQSCYSSNWRSLDNNALNSAEDEDDLEEGRENLANPKCTSLVPLSPEEEKIILMESAGEDLRRLRRMKPLQPPDVTSESEEAALPVLQHKRRRHKAIRQSSADNVSLYEELANSIEEEKEVPSFPLPLPELRGHTCLGWIRLYIWDYGKGILKTQNYFF